MSALAAGQLVSERYRLDRRIAVGGMGEVWEAHDIRLGRSVAVKALKADLSDDPEFLHRFRIEARTVASLDHSGIAAVHDYGEDDGPAGGGRTAYLVMELVRGEPLSTRISRGPLAIHEALDVLEQAARALDAAHERGFVHRDVKPGNILLRTDGVVKLTDFGIAKAADAVPVTRSGMVMGTAHYIAPEQASGEEAGPAGDVYSLGIVGYECLAGHRPFRADSAVAVAMMQVRDDPPPLPDDIPERIRGLIYSVLVKDPTQRYANGAEFAEAVAAVRRGRSAPVAGATGGEDSVSATVPGGPGGPGAVSGTPTPPPPGPPHAASEAVVRERPGRPPDRPGPTPPPGRPAVPGRGPTSGVGGAGRVVDRTTDRPPDVAPQDGAPPWPTGNRRTAAAPPPQRRVVDRPETGRHPVQGPPHRPDASPASPPVPSVSPVSPVSPSEHRLEHPSGPLDITPRRTGRSRALLAVVFVLLTLAAVAIAVLILRGGSLSGLTMIPVTGTSGTVFGWEDGLTGPADEGRPPVTQWPGSAVSVVR